MGDKIKSHGAALTYALFGAVAGVILGAWYLGVVKAQQQAGLHFDPLTSFVAGLPSWLVIIVILAVAIGPGVVSFTWPTLSKFVASRFGAAVERFTATREVAPSLDRKTQEFGAPLPADDSTHGAPVAATSGAAPDSRAVGPPPLQRLSAGLDQMNAAFMSTSPAWHVRQF